MAEQAFYPAVALYYFFKVSRACQDDELVLDTRASVNVSCLFVVAQPLCLLLGGYAGMLAYLATALVSYTLLPKKDKGEAGRGLLEEEKQKRPQIKEKEEKGAKLD